MSSGIEDKICSKLITPGIYDARVASLAAHAIVPPVASIAILGFEFAKSVAHDKIIRAVNIEKFVCFIVLS